jgi:tetratricopeptide (TPR) repeat protein
MKKLITFLTICTTVAILALPVAARNLIAQPDNAVQDPCATEAKDKMYESFRTNRTTDQAKAYEDAKKYLACPAGQVTEAQQKIIDYLKKWVAAYEEGTKKIKYRTALYNDMKYPEAYAMGKEILATEPDNLKVLVDLGVNGYLVAPLNNPTLTAESLEYAKKALALLESGKTLDDWQPLQSKEVAVAYLNYTIGALSLEKDPATALKHLIKAAQFETPLKKSPYTYAYIAGAYETGPYAKQSEDYKAKFSGKDETPESKLALANINQLVDRMIDGYARAVAVAGSDPKFNAQKPVWNESLTTWFKFRNNNTTTGMNELVAGILAKPLPPEPTPLTSLPASTPASSPASTSGAPQTTGTGTGNGAASTPAATSGAKPAASTPAAPSGAKPAAPKPDRPRNRRR